MHPQRQCSHCHLAAFRCHILCFREPWCNLITLLTLEVFSPTPPFSPRRQDCSPAGVLPGELDGLQQLRLQHLLLSWKGILAQLNSAGLCSICVPYSLHYITGKTPCCWRPNSSRRCPAKGCYLQKGWKVCAVWRVSSSRWHIQHIHLQHTHCEGPGPREADWRVRPTSWPLLPRVYQQQKAVAWMQELSASTGWLPTALLWPWLSQQYQIISALPYSTRWVHSSQACSVDRGRHACTGPQHSTFPIHTAYNVWPDSVIYFVLFSFSVCKNYTIA